MPGTSPALTVPSAGHVAARLSIASTWAFVAIVVVLHVVKPDFAPSWRFLSEYAIGTHGWLMRVAFLCWAVGCFALAVALRPQVGTPGGRIGVGVLVVVGASLVAAGTFTMDPVTARPEELTAEGRLHGFAAMVGIPGVPIAALLLGASLRRHPAWNRAWANVVRAGIACALCLVAMFAYMAIALPRAGGFGPDVLVGWFNRLVVASYVVWQIVTARGAIVASAVRPRRDG